MAALALQCFATDYAWYETRREALAAGYMIAEIRRGLEAIGSSSEENAWDLEMWNRLVVVATYRPIHRIEGIEKLLTLGLPTESPYRRMLISAAADRTGKGTGNRDPDVWRCRILGGFRVRWGRTITLPPVAPIALC